VEDVFTFADLMDVHEMIDVKARNERAVQKYLEKTRAR